MSIEEYIKIYEELQKYKWIVANIDKDYFFKFVDNLLSDYTRQKQINKEHQKEKRENQKEELAILNEKQKEMNKLINDVKTYKGQFKRQEKEIKKLQKENEEKNKQIDLMAEYIATLDIEEDICVKTGKDLNECNSMAFGECEDCIKQYFETKAKKGE